MERAVLTIAILTSWFVLAAVVATKQPLPVIAPAIVLVCALPVVWFHSRAEPPT